MIVSPALAAPLVTLGANVMMTLGVAVVLTGAVLVGSMISSKRTHRD